MGVVYKAASGGRCVAVKIQRPGVRETVAADAALLRAVAVAVASLSIGGSRLVPTSHDRRRFRITLVFESGRDGVGLWEDRECSGQPRTV